MSEEEKIERLLNSIAKGCDGSIADEVKAIIIKQQKEIEELKKPKYLVHFENNKITKMELINDYISKDKIRKRIEEARKIRWHTPKLVIEYFEELLEEN